MTIELLANESTPSTTWTTVTRKIARPPKAPTSTAAEGVLPGPMSTRNRRDPLTATIRYRGGSECWYELQCRGKVYRFSGSETVHDVMELINSGRGGRTPNEAGQGAQGRRRSRGL